jgi:hypothetical protein
MLDVHPPHHPTHTWRDFFIHIATIVVGLIIAVGLEQLVEAIHRHHERVDLRASLHRELEQIAFDSGNANADCDVHTAWLNQIEASIESSVQTGQPILAFPPPPAGKADDREDPFYRAAKSSGRLDLLDEEEIADFGEVDTLIEQSAINSQAIRSSYSELVVAEHKLQHPLVRASATAPSPSSTGDLALLQDRVLRLQMAVNADRSNSRFLHGAALAILRGERDLKHIEAAERSGPSH